MNALPAPSPSGDGDGPPPREVQSRRILQVLAAKDEKITSLELDKKELQGRIVTMQQHVVQLEAGVSKGQPAEVPELDSLRSDNARQQEQIEALISEAARLRQSLEHAQHDYGEDDSRGSLRHSPASMASAKENAALGDSGNSQDDHRSPHWFKKKATELEIQLSLAKERCLKAEFALKKERVEHKRQLSVLKLNPGVGEGSEKESDHVTAGMVNALKTRTASLETLLLASESKVADLTAELVQRGSKHLPSATVVATVEQSHLKDESIGRLQNLLKDEVDARSRMQAEHDTAVQSLNQQRVEGESQLRHDLQEDGLTRMKSLESTIRVLSGKSHLHGEVARLSAEVGSLQVDKVRAVEAVQALHGQMAEAHLRFAVGSDKDGSDKDSGTHHSAYSTIPKADSDSSLAILTVGATESARGVNDKEHLRKEISLLKVQLEQAVSSQMAVENETQKSSSDQSKHAAGLRKEHRKEVVRLESENEALQASVVRAESACRALKSELGQSQSIATSSQALFKQQLTLCENQISSLEAKVIAAQGDCEIAAASIREKSLQCAMLMETVQSMQNVDSDDQGQAIADLTSKLSHAYAAEAACERRILSHWQALERVTSQYNQAERDYESSQCSLEQVVSQLESLKQLKQLDCDELSAMSTELKIRETDLQQRAVEADDFEESIKKLEMEHRALQSTLVSQSAHHDQVVDQLTVTHSDDLRLSRSEILRLQDHLQQDAHSEHISHTDRQQKARAELMICVKDLTMQYTQTEGKTDQAPLQQVADHLLSELLKVDSVVCDQDMELRQVEWELKSVIERSSHCAKQLKAVEERLWMSESVKETLVSQDHVISLESRRFSMAINNALREQNETLSRQLDETNVTCLELESHLKVAQKDNTNLKRNVAGLQLKVDCSQNEKDSAVLFAVSHCKKDNAVALRDDGAQDEWIFSALQGSVDMQDSKVVMSNDPVVQVASLIRHMRSMKAAEVARIDLDHDTNCRLDKSTEQVLSLQRLVSQLEREMRKMVIPSDVTETDVPLSEAGSFASRLANSARESSDGFIALREQFLQVQARCDALEMQAEDSKAVQVELHSALSAAYEQREQLDASDRSCFEGTFRDKIASVEESKHNAALKHVQELRALKLQLRLAEEPKDDGSAHKQLKSCRERLEKVLAENKNAMNHADMLTAESAELRERLAAAEECVAVHVSSLSEMEKAMTTLYHRASTSASSAAGKQWLNQGGSVDQLIEQLVNARKAAATAAYKMRASCRAELELRKQVNARNNRIQELKALLVMDNNSPSSSRPRAKHQSTLEEHLWVPVHDDHIHPQQSKHKEQSASNHSQLVVMECRLWHMQYQLCSERAKSATAHENGPRHSQWSDLATPLPENSLALSRMLFAFAAKRVRLLASVLESQGQTAVLKQLMLLAGQFESFRDGSSAPGNSDKNEFVVETESSQSAPQETRHDASLLCQRGEEAMVLLEDAISQSDDASAMLSHVVESLKQSLDSSQQVSSRVLLSSSANSSLAESNAVEQLEEILRAWAYMGDRMKDVAEAFASVLVPMQSSFNFSHAASPSAAVMSAESPSAASAGTQSVPASAGHVGHATSVSHMSSKAYCEETILELELQNHALSLELMALREDNLVLKTESKNNFSSEVTTERDSPDEMAKLRAELAVFHELLNEDDDPRQHATLAAEQSRAKAQILLRCGELEDQVQQLLSDIDERDIELRKVVSQRAAALKNAVVQTDPIGEDEQVIGLKANVDYLTGLLDREKGSREKLEEERDLYLGQVNDYKSSLDRSMEEHTSQRVRDAEAQTEREKLRAEELMLLKREGARDAERLAALKAEKREERKHYARVLQELKEQGATTQQEVTKLQSNVSSLKHINEDLETRKVALQEQVEEQRERLLNLQSGEETLESQVLEKSTALSRLQMEYTATTISSEEDRQDRLKLCETVSTLEEKVTELRSGHIKVVAVADAQLRMLSERFLQVLKHEGISLQDWHSGAVASEQTLAQQDLLKLLSLLPAEGKGTMKPSSSTKTSKRPGLPLTKKRAAPQLVVSARRSNSVDTHAPKQRSYPQADGDVSIASLPVTNPEALELMMQLSYRDASNTALQQEVVSLREKLLKAAVSSTAPTTPVGTPKKSKIKSQGSRGNISPGKGKMAIGAKDVADNGGRSGSFACEMDVVVLHATLAAVEQRLIVSEREQATSLQQCGSLQRALDAETACSDKLHVSLKEKERALADVRRLLKDESDRAKDVTSTARQMTETLSSRESEFRQTALLLKEAKNAARESREEEVKKAKALAELRAEKNDLEKRLLDRATEAQGSEDKAKRHRQDSLRKDQTISELHARHKEISAAEQKATEERDALDLKMRSLTNDAGRKDGHVRELKLKMQSLMQDIEKLNVSLHERDSEISVLKKKKGDVERRDLQIRNLKEKVESANCEIATLRTKLTNRTPQLSSAKKKPVAVSPDQVIGSAKGKQEGASDLTSRLKRLKVWCDGLRVALLVIMEHHIGHLRHMKGAAQRTPFDDGLEQQDGICRVDKPIALTDKRSKSASSSPVRKGGRKRDTANRSSEQNHAPTGVGAVSQSVLEDHDLHFSNDEISDILDFVDASETQDAWKRVDLDLLLSDFEAVCTRSEAHCSEQELEQIVSRFCKESGCVYEALMSGLVVAEIEVAPSFLASLSDEGLSTLL